MTTLAKVIFCGFGVALGGTFLLITTIGAGVVFAKTIFDELKK